VEGRPRHTFLGSKLLSTYLNRTDSRMASCRVQQEVTRALARSEHFMDVPRPIRSFAGRRQACSAIPS